MSEALPSRKPALIRTSSPARQDTWLAVSGLVTSMLALPLAQSTWHGPEVAAVLAVAAVALLAGQRWAIAVLVIAELFLVPTVWPRAFFPGADDLTSRLVALATLVAMAPGLVAMRRAASVLIVISGQRRTARMHRRFHAGLVAMAALAIVLPLL